jgi:hypothetical protein
MRRKTIRVEKLDKLVNNADTQHDLRDSVTEIEESTNTRSVLLVFVVLAKAHQSSAKNFSYHETYTVL